MDFDSSCGATAAALTSGESNVLCAKEEIDQKKKSTMPEITLALLWVSSPGHFRYFEVTLKFEIAPVERRPLEGF